MVQIFINQRSPSELEYKVIPYFSNEKIIKEVFLFLIKFNMSFSSEVCKEKKK
jgi:hypothetical protein